MGPDGYYVEESADEIFSGPTHELVPSSYSSFHRLHWPHRDDEEGEEQPRSRRESMWSHRSDASMYTNDDDPEHVGRFQFFSRDEISHAEGASTVIGDDDSVHESFIDSDNDLAAAYSSDSDENRDGGAEDNGRRRVRRWSSRSAHSHGISDRNDTDDAQSGDELLPEHHHRPFLGESDSELSGTASQLVGDSHQEHHSGHHHEYNSHRFQQRYYIAEEDMRIVCAGYSSVRWRVALYGILCVLSGGILFLLGRWFPRQRLRLTARETPLGKCEFIVVENQWGELERVYVEIQRYNHPLSSIFNLANMETLEEQHNTHHHNSNASTRSRQLSADTEQLQPRTSGSRRSSVSSYVDSDPNVPYLRVISYRYIRFIYNPVKDMFFTNTDWISTSWSTTETATDGLDGEVQEQRELVFGRNSLDIAQPSTVKLLVDEVLHPFYIFQVFSIILWSLDDYLYYATAIFIISILSVAEALSETKKSLARLAEVAHANSETEITVLRSGFWITIPSEELVPGDVYELSSRTLSMIPVDSVLLSGDCIVNESILTGESVPVSKLPATDNTLAALVAEGTNSSSITRSFIYAGTKIIRVRKPPAENDDFQPALALAVRTGFTTTKGALVRSMMFPRPSGFRFYRDSFRYIGVMAIVALIGFSISAVNFVILGLDTSLIILRALDIITVVVPPALPATLTIGTNFSLQRLRQKSVFCITPSRVNVGGRVNLVAFDKTGTLTEEGLDVFGVHLVHTHSEGRRKFGRLLKSSDELAKEEEDTGLLDTLVTCHELRNVDGTIMGDPLDVKMFEFTNWTFDDERKKFTSPKGKGPLHELKVYKQFEFVSQLRRMSVIASSGKNLASGGTRVLAKGAPEIMRQICLPKSLPMNFDEVLHQYTHRGYRVIACAWRDVGDISDYDRTELEAELTFAGLIVFENKLKPQTSPAIQTLAQAEVRSLMCTGDNLLTALSVARECSIIPPSEKARVYAGHFNETGELRWEGVDDPLLKLDPQTLKPKNASENHEKADYLLAVTGDVFSHVVEQGSYDALDQMLLRGVVFARMSPDEKHELVMKLQQIDYTVCFCGDGANDCGALKEADVGVSLSEAEASVAAPFTSRRFDISCVIDVLAEGRCALNTSFSCFKYMSMYSAIQFVTVTILYSYGSNIGDFQFLWIDLFLIVPIAAFMAWSGPSAKLSRKRPGAELVSRKVLVPLLSYMIIMAIFQIMPWKLSHKQPGYIPPVPGDNDNLKSTDNTVLFYMSSFQYIVAGWAFCEGPPFRIGVLHNIPFLTTIVLTVAITLVFMTIDPSSAIGDLMDLTPLPGIFKMTIIGFVLANAAVMVLAREFLFAHLCNIISGTKRLMGSHKVRPRYKEIKEESELHT